MQYSISVVIPIRLVLQADNEGIAEDMALDIITKSLPDFFEYSHSEDVSISLLDGAYVDYIEEQLWMEVNNGNSPDD